MKLRKPNWFDPLDRVFGILGLIFLLVLMIGLMLPPHVNVCSWKPRSIGTK